MLQITQFMKPHLIIALLVIVSAVLPAHNEATQTGANSDNPKNIIIMISDGLGPQGTVAARLAKGEPLFLDSIVVGLQSTRSTDSPVTDSAASATAIACGVPSSNGRIGMDPRELPLATIMEGAQEKGMATGLVATSRITHATPGSFAAHVPLRSREDLIAEQLLESKIDFFIGGGARTFPEDMLTAARDEFGFTTISSKEELAALDAAADQRVIGLFSNSHMPYFIDRKDDEDQVSLADMTKFALDYMETRRDQGFVLMIEGSRIDHAAHANDLAGYIHDTLEYDDAVRLACERSREWGDTLVVSVADHDCGGFSVGADQVYDFDVAGAMNVTGSSDAIRREISQDRSNTAEVLKKYTGVEFTEEEIAPIMGASSQGYAFGNSIGPVVSSKFFAGWTTHGHTGADVTRYADGPGADQLTGVLHHAEMGALLQEMIGVRETVLALTAKMQEGVEPVEPPAVPPAPAKPQ